MRRPILSSLFTRWVSIALMGMLVLQAEALSVFAGSQARDIRVIVVDAGPLVPGETTHDLKVQIQDLSVGPLPGARVTFTLPQGAAGGSFPNGAKTVTVTTDMNGLAVAAAFQPVDPARRVAIQVQVLFQAQRVTTSMTYGVAVGQTKTSSKKWLLIVGAAGVAAVAGGLAAGRSGTPTGTSSAISLQPGTLTIIP